MGSEVNPLAGDASDEAAILNEAGEAVSKWLTNALLVVTTFVQDTLGMATKSCDAFLSYPATGGNPAGPNPVAWEVVEAGRLKGRTETKHGISDRPAMLLNPGKVKDAAAAVFYMIPAYLSILIPPEVQKTKADLTPLANGVRVVQFPKAYTDAYTSLGYSGRPDRPVANGNVVSRGGQVPRSTMEVIMDLAGMIETEAGAFPADAIEAYRNSNAETGRNLKMTCSRQVVDGVPLKFTQKTKAQEHFSGSTTAIYADAYKAEHDKETGITYTFWPCPRRFLADETRRCDGFVAIVPNAKQVIKNREAFAKAKKAAEDTARENEPTEATGTDDSSGSAQ